MQPKGFSARIIWIALQFFNIKTKVAFSTRFPGSTVVIVKNVRQEGKVSKISETGAVIARKKKS